MRAIAAIVISVLAAATLGACGPSSDTKSPDGKTMSKDSGMKGMDMSKGDVKGMEMKGMDSGKQAEGQVHQATGKVTKVDRAAGTVTVDHEPVPSMKWPSMTMAFKAKDKAMLEKAKEGSKVDFSFVQYGKDYVITDIK
jgi:Cu(I)/Ag(I) efflux system protein CusF